MIRRSILIASTAVALTVAGCGGNDPSPTPSPSPTPTPSPSPSPISYSSFPLTAAVEMFTVSAAMSYTGDPAGPVTLGTAGTDGFSNRVRLALQSALTSTMTTEEVVRENTEESRFTGPDMLTGPTPAALEYVFRESTAPTTPGQFTQLELLNNTIASQVTTDPLLGTLTRVSYGAWWRGDSTAGAKRVTYGTFGYPTVPSDMPTTGTVNYTMRVAGRVVISPAAGASTVAKLDGTVTTSINYATGLVTVTLNLTQGGAAYGTFTGTGAIAAGNNQFTGSFGPGSTAGGTFQGLAYGPQAAELGISFAITGTDSRAVGVLVGKKS
ncbi:transferrin-binding protein-like solute binding protein [Sphingomonas sp. MS122]|uniref:transferrin-binding protein-like solute binding protein n=1 Tax=Sphingomonas sp. MS122 TaxID=3412683 RepID=UPI003C2B2430